jgi:hypothetical protein
VEGDDHGEAYKAIVRGVGSSHEIPKVAEARRNPERHMEVPGTAAGELSAFTGAAAIAHSSFARVADS